MGNSAIGVRYLQVSISGEKKRERYCSETKNRRRGGQNEKPRASGSQDFSVSA